MSNCRQCGQPAMANFLAPDLCGSCYYNPIPMKPLDQVLWKIPNQELILQEIINQKDRRIAELEAELHEMREATKQRYKTTIKVQTALEAEEGEG